MRALSAIAALLLPATALAGNPVPGPGGLVFTELHFRASGAAEWVELYNPGAGPLSLAGCTFEHDDGGGPESAALDGLEVPGEAFVLLSRAECAGFEPDGTTCAAVPDFVYEGFSLSDSAATVAIRCAGTLVDSVAYTWEEVEDDCVGAGNGTCAVGLDPEEFGDGPAMAAANDAWPGSWCVPPASSFVIDSLGRDLVGTPGGPNRCPPLGGGCEAGDLVFSELMVAPPEGAAPWFELHAATATGCDLHGCVLQVGPFADPDRDPTSTQWTRHEIDAPGNTLPALPGQWLLFAEDEVLGAREGGPDIRPDYRFAGLNVEDDREYYAHLLCRGRPVDTAAFDWRLFAPFCPVTACSLSIVEGVTDPATNDSPAAWCPPLPVAEYRSPDGEFFDGSPGGPGSCLQRDWPEAGDVVFTEIMAAPANDDSGAAEHDGLDFAEWFELTDLQGGGADLTGCRLENATLDEEGEPGTVLTYVLGSDGRDAPLRAAGSILFAAGDRCIDGTSGVRCSMEEHHFHGSISFGNSARERLDLVCPDGAGGEVLVDRAVYDLTAIGARDGHSVQFDSFDTGLPEANDEPLDWCEASFQDAYAIGGTGVVNYGTPGTAGRCRTGQVDVPPSGPGCACEAAPRGRAEPLGLLLLLLPLLRRRRESA